MQVGMAPRFLMTLLIVCLFPGVGGAFCLAPNPPPSPPTLYRPQPPIPPYCLNEFTGTHTCQDWEIANYNNAIQQYKIELQDYLLQLQQYVSNAEQFANEARIYATCEINSLQ